jgi:nucleoside-diphosphate-sugar epimerase
MKNKKEKILIIGGTGFLGYHLSKRCLKKYSVTSVSLKKPNKNRKLKYINYIHFDISKKKSFRKINKKEFEYVINCGGHVDHKNKIKTYNSHFIGVRNLISFFLKKKKLKKFIQIGSSAEYGKIKSPQFENSSCKPKLIYGRSKLNATKFAINQNKKKNFPTVILRFYQIFGPKQSYNRLIPIVINACLNNKKFPCSSGLQKRDFLYVDDAVNAIMLLIKSNKEINGILNIGYGKCITVKKVINYITNKIGKGEPEYNKIKLRKDEAKIIFPNILKAKTLLNWKPKVSFNEGLKKTINSYKNDYR